MKLLKKWYENFLKNIEKANKENFGNEKLGCCGLNSNHSKNSKNNKNQK